MRSYDTIIVGAGPSGMTAALWCARGGQRVLLMDRCERIGKKILVTGNGRCNLTNRRQEPECYRGEDPEKIAGVLSAFDLADTMEFFIDWVSLPEIKMAMCIPITNRRLPSGMLLRARFCPAKDWMC